MAIRLAVLVVGLAAAAATAVALVGRGGDGLALDPVAQAASTTSADTSFRFTFRAGDGTAAGTVRGEGAYDAGDRLLRTTFAMPGLGAGDVTMIADSSDGLVVYVSFPILAQILPQGKSWVSVDVAKAADARGFDIRQ